MSEAFFAGAPYFAGVLGTTGVSVTKVFSATRRSIFGALETKRFLGRLLLTQSPPPLHLVDGRDRLQIDQAISTASALPMKQSM